MGLIKFFHKLKIWLTRVISPSVPYVPQSKRYGTLGEIHFYRELKRLLPSVKLKRNILVKYGVESSEIDCIAIYENKVFAIEVKRWKGNIIESENGFTQIKRDRWGEKHIKYHKSPVRQLNRAISLLKKQTGTRVWINNVIYFDSERCMYASMQSENIFVNDMERLVAHIENCGEKSDQKSIIEFFDKCVAADQICIKGRENYLQGKIYDSSLPSMTNDGLILRKDIDYIDIFHNMTYDILSVHLKDGRVYSFESENSEIRICIEDEVQNIAVSKIDRIVLG